MKIGSDYTTEHDHFSITRHRIIRAVIARGHHEIDNYATCSSIDIMKNNATCSSIAIFRYTGNCGLFEHQTKIAAMETQLNALMDADKKEEQDG